MPGAVRPGCGVVTGRPPLPLIGTPPVALLNVCAGGLPGGSGLVVPLPLGAGPTPSAAGRPTTMEMVSPSDTTEGMSGPAGLPGAAGETTGSPELPGAGVIVPRPSGLDVVVGGKTTASPGLSSTGGIVSRPSGSPGVVGGDVTGSPGFCGGSAQTHDRVDHHFFLDTQNGLNCEHKPSRN